VRRIAHPASGQPSTSVRLALLSVALEHHHEFGLPNGNVLVHDAELRGRSSPCGFTEKNRMKGENDILKTESGHDGKNQIMAPRRPEGIFNECCPVRNLYFRTRQMYHME
jgi:hypothetical protein